MRHGKWRRLGEGGGSGWLGEGQTLLGLEELIEELFCRKHGLRAGNWGRQGWCPPNLVGRRMVVYPAWHRDAPAGFLEANGSRQ